MTISMIKRLLSRIVATTLIAVIIITLLPLGAIAVALENHGLTLLQQSAEVRGGMYTAADGTVYTVLYNDYIAVYVNRNDGGFAILPATETFDATKPLSYASFQVDNNMYRYGRYYEGVSGIVGIAPMVGENKTLDSHWQIGDFVISQIFAITSDTFHDNSYAVKIGYAAQYFGEGIASIAGCILLDTQFTTDESVPIMLIDSEDNILLAESEVYLRPPPSAALINKEYIEEVNLEAGETIYENSPNKGYLIFDDSSFASPNAVIIAEFGRAGAALAGLIDGFENSEDEIQGFEYIPSGVTLFDGSGSDSAAVFCWDEVGVSNGDQAAFGTNYGFYDLELGHPSFNPLPEPMSFSALSGEVNSAVVVFDYPFVNENWFDVKLSIHTTPVDDSHGYPGQRQGIISDTGDPDEELLIIVDYKQETLQIIKEAIKTVNVQIRWEREDGTGDSGWLVNLDEAPIGEEIKFSISDAFRDRSTDPSSFLRVSLHIDANNPATGFSSISLDYSNRQIDAERFTTELSGDHVALYDMPYVNIDPSSTEKRYLVRQGFEVMLSCEMNDIGYSIEEPSTHNVTSGGSFPLTAVSSGPLTYAYTFMAPSAMKYGSIYVQSTTGLPGDQPQPINVKAFHASQQFLEPDIENALWNAISGSGVTSEMGLIWALPGETVEIDFPALSAYSGGNIYLYKSGTDEGATGVTNPITSNFTMPDEPVDLVYENGTVYRVFTEVTGSGHAAVTVNSTNGSAPQTSDNVFIFVTNIEEGYQIDSITASGAVLTEIPGGSWEFIMPSADVTITVNLDITPAPRPFYNVIVKPLVGDGMVLYDLMLWTDDITGSRSVYQVDEAGRTGQIREGETVYYVLYPTVWNIDPQYVPDMSRWVVDGFTMNGTTLMGFSEINGAPAYFPSAYNSSNPIATAGNFIMPNNDVEFEITGYNKDHNYSLSIEAYDQYGNRLEWAEQNIYTSPATNGTRETWFEYPEGSGNWMSSVHGVGQFPIDKQTAVSIQRSIYDYSLQRVEMIAGDSIISPVKTETEGNFTTYYFNHTWPYNGTIKVYYQDAKRTLTIDGYPRGDGYYIESGEVLVLPGEAWNAPGGDTRRIEVVPLEGIYETFITLRWSAQIVGQAYGTYYYLDNANSTNCIVEETHRNANGCYAVYKVTFTGTANARTDIQARNTARDIGFSNYFMPNSPNSATFETITLAAEYVIVTDVVSRPENMRNIMTATPAPKITGIGLMSVPKEPGGQDFVNAITADNVFTRYSSVFSWEDSTGERMVLDIRELFDIADDYIFPDGSYTLTIEYAYGEGYSQTGSKDYIFELGYDKFRPGELTHVAVVRVTQNFSSLPEGTPAGLSYGNYGCWIAVPGRNYNDMAEQARQFNPSGHFIYFVCETGFKTSAHYPYGEMSGTHQYLADGGATVNMSGGGSFSPNSSMGGFSLNVGIDGLTVRTKEMKFNSSWMPLFSPTGTGSTRTDMISLYLEHGTTYTIPEALPDFGEIRHRHATHEEAAEEWMDAVEEVRTTMLAMRIEYPDAVYSGSDFDDFLSANIDGKGVAISVGGFEGGLTFDIKDIYLMSYGYETGGRLNIQIPGMTIPILRLEVISMTTDSWAQYLPISDIWAEGEGRVQLPSALAGWGASAYGVFNTYLDNYGFDGEINFHFIELSGSFYLAKTSYGFPMLDTFIVSFGVNDIPVGLGLPPAPAQIIELEGITLGVTNLADTVSYNPLKNTIPSVRIILGAKFSLVEIFGFNAEMWAELLSVGFTFNGGLSVGPLSIDIFKEISMGAGAKDGPYMPYDDDPYYAAAIKGKRSITFFVNAKIHAYVFLADASVLVGLNMTISPALWEKRDGFDDLQELFEFINGGLTVWGAGSFNILPLSDDWSLIGTDITVDAALGVGRNIRVMPIEFTQFMLELNTQLLGVTVEKEKINLLAYYIWLQEWLMEKMEEQMWRFSNRAGTGAMSAMNSDFALVESARMQISLLSEALATPEIFGAYGDMGNYSERRSFIDNVEADSENRSGNGRTSAGNASSGMANNGASMGIMPLSIPSGGGTISAEYDGNNYTHHVTVPSVSSDYILRLTGYGGYTPDFTDFRVYKPNGQALVIRGASGEMTAAQAEFGYNAVILNGALLLSLADYLEQTDGVVTGVGSTLSGTWQVVSDRPFKSELIRVDDYPRVSSVELSSGGIVSARFEHITDTTNGEYFYSLTLEKKGDPSAQPLEAMTLLSNMPVPPGGVISHDLTNLINPAGSASDNYNINDILASGDWYARITLRQGSVTRYTMNSMTGAITQTSGSGIDFLTTSYIDDKTSQTAYTVNNTILNAVTWTPSLTAVSGGNQSIDIGFSPASDTLDMTVVGYHVTVYNAFDSLPASRLSVEIDATGNTVQKVVPMEYDVMTGDLSPGQTQFSYNIGDVPIGSYKVGVSPLYADIVPELDEDGFMTGEFVASSGVTRRGTEHLSSTVSIAQASPPSLSMSVSGGNLTNQNGHAIVFAGPNATLTATSEAGATIKFYLYDGTPVSSVSDTVADLADFDGQMLMVIAENANKDSTIEYITIYAAAAPPLLLPDNFDAASGDFVFTAYKDTGNYTITGQADPGADICGTFANYDGRFRIVGTLGRETGGVNSDTVTLAVSNAAGMITIREVNIIRGTENEPYSPPPGNRVDSDQRQTDNDNNPEPMDSGIIVETPEDGDPITNEDGSLTLPLGGIVTLPNGTVIVVPAGTEISADGRSIVIPGDSGGATIIHFSGNTFNIRENMVVIIDSDNALGYYVDQVNHFADISEEQWYYNYALFAYAHGLMNGTSEQPMLFSPDMPLTRGMIVTVLHRLAGSPDVSGLQNPFSDVPEGSYYTDAVIWAASCGIINGYGGGLYGPEDNVTREQLAVIINNYAVYSGLLLLESNDYSPFIDDADIANYAKEAIERFFRAGIIGGYPDGSFRPRDEASRAEFAAMLMRFIEASYRD